VTALAGEGDPPTALFTFFTEMVAQAAGKKTVIDLQARTGTEIAARQHMPGRAPRLAGTAISSAAP
jgi:hypothetical protein